MSDEYTFLQPHTGEIVASSPSETETPARPAPSVKSAGFNNK